MDEPVSPRSGGVTQRLAATLAGLIIVTLASFAGPKRTLVLPSADAPVDSPAVQALLRVLNPEGEPVAEARVHQSDGSGWVLLGETNAEGLLAFDQADFDADFQVSADAYATRLGPIALEDVGDADLRRVASITLQVEARLFGRVVDLQDQPIPDASVRVVARSNDLGAGSGMPVSRLPESWMASTDAAGRFEVRALPEGPVAVQVDVEGYGSAYRSGHATRDSGEELHIVVSETASLRGRVTLADSLGGGPGAGASVIVAGSGLWPPRQVTVAEDGTFVFRGIPDGVYEARAEKDAFTSPPIYGIDLSAGEEREVQLVLTRGFSYAAQVVRARDRQPIPHARISIRSDAVSLHARTAVAGPDGSFVVQGLLPGAHRLSIEAEGYVALRDAPLAVPTGDVESPTHELRQAATVEGRVVDHRGFPISGVRVSLLGTTDDQRPIQIAAGFEAFRAELFDVQNQGAFPVTAAGELGVTLGEVPPISAARQAGFSDSSAASGPTASPPPPSGTMQYGSSFFATDDQGRFRITGVPPGEVEVVAQKRGYAVGRSAPRFVQAGDEAQGVEVELLVSGSVEGRISDRRGFPLSGVRVEMRSEGTSFVTSATSDPNGEYRLEDAAGALLITATADDLPPVETRVEVASGEAAVVNISIDLVLHHLSGRTVDRRGFPVGGVHIALRTLSARSRARRWVISDADGAFSISGLPPPPFRLDISHPDYALATRMMPAGGSEDVEHEATLTLEDGAAIAGRVLGRQDNAPLPNLLVTLSSAGPTRDGLVIAPRQARTNEEGHYAFERAAPGAYRLTVEAEGFVPEARSVAHERGARSMDPLEVEDIYLTLGGAISGIVVDALGDPVPGAEVALGEPPQWSEALRTNVRGEYRFEGLAESNVMVTARHSGAGEAELPAARRIRRGETAEDARISLPGRYHPDEVQAGGTMRTGVGLVLRIEGTSVVVDEVVPRTLAQRRGLRPGDVLVSVDDERPLSARHGEGLLRGPEGHEAMIVVSRRGREIRVEIPRERYRHPRSETSE